MSIRRSAPLDAEHRPHAYGPLGEVENIPQGVPHGECGVWGWPHFQPIARRALFRGFLAREIGEIFGAHLKFILLVITSMSKTGTNPVTTRVCGQLPCQ